ncbi:hypothetical protein B0J12DRAFT_366273 [Macrophomina phaseolina]|uniref:Secreted protein n=1 Tax=Macrophomina phaseolina TaxID=35725 RepID=A0ABQ8FTC3_9PEZI|nr:hypothetical protein B0J12DRAFT_366273 [Macrophomina phaseolina]
MVAVLSSTAWSFLRRSVSASEEKSGRGVCALVAAPISAGGSSAVGPSRPCSSLSTGRPVSRLFARQPACRPPSSPSPSMPQVVGVKMLDMLPVPPAKYGNSSLGALRCCISACRVLEIQFYIPGPVSDHPTPREPWRSLLSLFACASCPSLTRPQLRSLARAYKVQPQSQRRT